MEHFTLQNALDWLDIQKARYLWLYRGEGEGKNNLVLSLPAGEVTEFNGQKSNLIRAESTADLIAQLRDSFNTLGLKGVYTIQSASSNTQSTGKKSFTFAHNYQPAGAQKQQNGIGMPPDFFDKYIELVGKQAETRAELQVQEMKFEIEKLKSAQTKEGTDWTAFFEKLAEFAKPFIPAIVAGISRGGAGVGNLPHIPTPNPTNYQANEYQTNENQENMEDFEMANATDENQQRFIEAVTRVQSAIGDELTIKLIEKIAGLVEKKPELANKLISTNDNLFMFM
jgi:hypothetical protein